MEDNSKTIIYFDGAISANPGGIVTYGYCIMHDGLTLTTGAGIAECGDGATCNVAEYVAAYKALAAALAIKPLPATVILRGDSRLVINQLDGEWDCHADHLRPWLARTLALALAFDKIFFEWIPRSKNWQADALSQTAPLRVEKDEETQKA